MARVSAASARVFARLLPEEERPAYLEQHAPPPTARRAGGTLANDLGADFEAFLAAQHRRARSEGFARLRKVGPPIRRTGPGGERIEVTGVGPADYQGAIAAADPRAPWRLLAVEAKSREGRLQRHEFAPHQVEDLEWVAAVGGVALAAIELHTAAHEQLGIWALPWAELERRWKVTSRGGKTSRSVGPDELAGWEVPPVDTYLSRFAFDGAVARSGS